MAASIDQAATALATAVGVRERLVACLALAEAAQAEADALRAALRDQAEDWLCNHCRQAWPAGIEPAHGNCPHCTRPLTPSR